ncbi:MAG: two-component system, sensor histidine kinase YesM [Epulopiscium sp.]|nr:two-component system, sensor histidine kinase YesM [Candidatus Epulonipiscium sp.]
MNQEELINNLGQLNTYADGGVILLNIFHDGIMIKQTNEKLNLPITNIFISIQGHESQGIKVLEDQQEGYYIAYAKSDYLHMVLLKYVPKEYVVQPLKKIHVWIWLFSLASICIFLIYSYSTYKYMHKPLSRLVSAFRKVEQGDLEVSITHESNDEFEYLYSRFNDMVRKIKVLIEQVYQQKILTQRAELKQLQSQINPHFLYNSFFLINTMARIGDDNLIIFTKRLGEYFRFVTRNNSDNIPLKDEVNHARVYTEIQQMRFSKRLTITFDSLPEKYNELTVPRLILQPIVENAFEHSIEKKKSGLISIGFSTYDSGLDIIVEDNGDDMTDEFIHRLNTLINTNEDYSEVTGLINISRRVKLMFGSDSGVHFYRSKLGGAKVVLRIRMGGSNL